jgi:DNA polymerase-1
VLFVGEAPGAEEVEKGTPFVGPAGRCLRKFIRLAGLTEEECAFTNVVRCRPPVKLRPLERVASNRPPSDLEIVCCSRNLESDLQKFRGDLIVLLGNVPVTALLGHWHVGSAHGYGFFKDGRRFYVMYHPSYILRDQSRKLDTLYLEEMKKVKKFLDFSHKVPYNIIESKGQAEVMVQSILDEAGRREGGAVLSFDIETTGLDPLSPDASVISIAFTLRDGQTWFVPLVHSESPNQDCHEDIVDILRPLFVDSRIKLVAQNAKFDLKYLKARYGVGSLNLWMDTQLAAFLLDGKNSPLGLHQCAWKYTDFGGWEIDTSVLIEKSLTEISDYNAMDAFVTNELSKVYQQRLSSSAFEFLTTILTPVVYALIEMELEGVSLDFDRLQEFSRTYEERLQALLQKLLSYPEVEKVSRTLVRELNFNSSGHVKQILGEMKIVPEKRTKRTGEVSVDEEALESVKSKHPFVDDLLQYRAAQKILGTYLVPYSSIGVGGVVRGEYLLTRTATGRLACQRPNFQNIPKEIRPVFRSRYGMFIEVDYSQMELRVLAMYSKDPELVSTFRNGLDIHEMTRRAIFGSNDHLSDLEKAKQRVEAKSVNFGIVYGESAHGLSKQLKISLAEADERISAFYKKYKGVRSFVDQVRKQVQKMGYVETYFGRRRYFPIDTAQSQTEWEAFFREAVNAPIQGTASDLALDATVRVWKRMRKDGLKSRMVMNVHDMILFDCFEDEVERMLVIIYEEMERFDFPWVNVPVKVDVAIGTNWGELVEVN